MAELAVPALVAETAVDSGADAVTARPLAQVALAESSGRNDLAVVAFEAGRTPALVDAAAPAAGQARDHALCCRTCNPYTQVALQYSLPATDTAKKCDSLFAMPQQWKRRTRLLFYSEICWQLKKFFFLRWSKMKYLCEICCTINIKVCKRVLKALFIEIWLTSNFSDCIGVISLQ